MRRTSLDHAAEHMQGRTRDTYSDNIGDRHQQEGEGEFHDALVEMFDCKVMRRKIVRERREKTREAFKAFQDTFNQ